jgi:hypothetical protein
LTASTARAEDVASDTLQTAKIVVIKTQMAAAHAPRRPLKRQSSVTVS